MENDNKNRARKSYITLLFVGILFSLMGSLFSYKPIKIFFTWIKTIATVESVSRHLDSDGDSIYTPTLIYTCSDNIPRRDTPGYSSNTFNYNIWEQILIYCDKNDSTSFIIVSFQTYLPVFFLLIGMLFLWIAIKEIIQIIYIHNVKKKLLVSGVKIEAKTTKILETKWKTGEQSNYTIQATDWVHIFTSEKIFFDVKEFLNEGDTVIVYVDLANPKKHRIDVDLVLNNGKKIPKTTLPKEMLEMTTSELIKFRDDQNKLRWYIESSFFFNTLFGWILHSEEMETMRDLIDEEIKKRQS